MIFVYLFFLAISISLMLEARDGLVFFSGLFFSIIFIVFIALGSSDAKKEPKPLPKTGEINPFSLNNNANSLR